MQPHLILGAAALLYTVDALGTNQMCQVDLGIALDSSCSIEPHKTCNGNPSHDCPNWSKAVSFVKQIAATVNVAPDGAWVSLVEFAKQVSDNLLPSGDNSTVQAALNELPKHGPQTMGCETYTAVGLKHTEDMLLMKARPRAPKVALVITDGKPVGSKHAPRRAINQASDMKHHGIRVIGVGVGPNIDRKFMEMLVSNPSDYFTVGDWADISSLINNITDSACGTKYECIDDSMCMPSNSTAAVPKDACESTCGAKYECITNTCTISTDPKAVSKYDCEYACGHSVQWFPPPGVDGADEITDDTEEGEEEWSAKTGRN